MRIFNRETQSHILFKVLEEMLKSTVDNQRAISCNFMHEPRVSRKREKFFLQKLGRCTTSKGFKKLLVEYKKKWIQLTPNPDFEHSHNVRNRTSALKEQLITILIVNGLSTMFLWARNLPKIEIAKLSREQRKAFHRFKDYPNTEPDVLGFITDAMRSKLRRGKFLEQVFTLYEIYRQGNPYNPIWLTKRREFLALERIKVSNKANLWCHWVGISTAQKAGQWVVVLRFRARHFKNRIYRPTVLEAGDNFYHFPAPEGVPGGGRAADLQTGSAVLACEYIATWPSLIGAEVDFDYGCAQLKPCVQKTIGEIRNHHIDRLRREFHGMQKAAKWLKRLAGS